MQRSLRDNMFRKTRNRYKDGNQLNLVIKTEESLVNIKDDQSNRITEYTLSPLNITNKTVDTVNTDSRLYKNLIWDETIKRDDIKK